MNLQAPRSTFSNHRKKVLVVEDEEQFSRPIKRWLNKEGYHVTIKTSLEEAKNALETDHFHAAVIDIRLNRNDPDNQDGMKLLEIIEEMGLSEFLPRIILTAQMIPKVILDATMYYNARYVVKDPGYGTVLKEELKKIFEKQVQINFDLNYELGSAHILPDIAKDVKWADEIQPPEELLTEQIRDIFGKLFNRADSLYIRQMKPGLTGASILRAEPGGKFGYAPAHVVKIGRQDKIQTEHDNFKNYVKDFLPQAAIQVEVAYTHNLGGILYTFMGNAVNSFDEFDDFYHREDPDTIIHSLRDLIHDTCTYWYNQNRLLRVDLQVQYLKAFRLEHARLVQAIRDIIPDYDPLQREIIFPATQAPIINPLDWMEENREDFIMMVLHSITHGDLTGRNIMVDTRQKCWLIDFYRTYPSHILRDFLILETDIKYRLMPCPDLESFIRLETSLSSGDFSRPGIALDPALPPALQKAARVIHALRHTASRLAMSVGGEQGIRQEYMRSLLMATLNVIRLRHIEPPRKLMALYASHMICHQFDLQVSK